MDKYIYFVSYSHRYGNGCIEIMTDSLIDDYSYIDELCKETIPNKNGLSGVVVLNYQLLRHKGVSNDQQAKYAELGRLAVNLSKHICDSLKTDDICTHCEWYSFCQKRTEIIEGIKQNGQ